MTCALPPEWRSRLDAVAAELGVPTSSWPGLPAAVRALSDAYNSARFPRAWTPELLAARLHFFLVRDAAKVASAVRDVPLAWTGEAPLRLRDFGAGIGASALGLVLGLRDRGVTVPLSIHLGDADPGALAVAERVLRGLPGVAVSRTLPPAVDLLVVANVLVEMDRELPGARRAEVHAQRLGDEVAALSPGGRVVVVEPALRPAARHLQVVRDLLVGAGVQVVAPCAHDGPCPLLRRDADWCHDDVPVDLPPWLQPVARAARLRWQGLTYARLVLAPAPVPRPTFRVVAGPRDSRGRKERLLCGELDGASLTWVDRLDKHASAENAAFAALSRGDGVELEPPGRRVGASTRVRAWPLPAAVNGIDQA